MAIRIKKGSLVISSDGSRHGSGAAARVYDRYLATLSIPAGEEGVPQKQHLRDLVLSMVEVLDFVSSEADVAGSYTICVPLFPYAHSRPTVSTHLADANTVGLWQGDPPGNSSSGLVDSSGHGLTLEYSSGGAGKYGEIGYGQEAFLCDGTNYWRRVSNVNDASLNLTGDSTLEFIVLPFDTAAFPGTILSYGNNAAANTNNAVLFNANLKKSTAVFSLDFANTALLAHYYETSPFSPNPTGHTNTDVKLFPIFRPTHCALVYSASAATLTPYINGFKQPIQTGLVAKAIGGTPVQRLTIGADSGAAFPFKGFVSSVKISNVERNADYILKDAARTLGTAAREISLPRPFMRIAEASVLTEAFLTADMVTGTFAAPDFSGSIIRVDGLGAQTTVATLNGNAVGATGWTALQSKQMTVSDPELLLHVGDTLALQGTSYALSGALTMRFGRVIS